MTKLKYILFIFTCVFTTQPAQASLQVRVGTIAGAPAWTFVYKEAGKWVLDRVVTAEDGWPELERHEVMKGAEPNLAAAAAALESTTEVGTELPEEIEAELRFLPEDSLWPVTSAWTWEWEKKFAEWITTQVDEQFFLKYGVATDCADAAYGLRWIFARIHGLPAVSRLSTGHWFSNRSVRSEWRRLPVASEWHKDRRFLAALNYLFNMTYTHSLGRDSYPVAIGKDSLLPGSFHLAIYGDSGHTQIISEVNLDQDHPPVLTLASTVPKEVRALSENIFFESYVAEGKSGLLRFRWPVFTASGAGLVPADRMPYYSKEEYDADFVRAPRTEFWQEVFFRINPALNLSSVAERALNQLAERFRERNEIVEQGWAVCSRKSCKKGTPEWEAWSTPSRDGRISNEIRIYQQLSAYHTNAGEVRRLMDQKVISQGGVSFNLREMIEAWQHNYYSSDPTLSPFRRWGMHPQGVADSIVDSLKQNLTAREAHIAKSARACSDPAKCPFGSKAFFQASPIRFDTAVSSLAEKPGEYCRFMSDENCRLLRETLEKSMLTFGARTESALTWIREASFFNSDPRHNRQRLDYGYSREWPAMSYQAPSESGGVFVNLRNAWLAFAGHNGNGFKAAWTINRQSLVPVELPTADRTIVAVGPEPTWVWSMQGDTLFSSSFALGAAPEAKLNDFAPFSWAAAWNEKLLVVRERSIVVYERSASGIQVVLEKELSDFYVTRADRGLYRVQTGEEYFLLDVMKKRFWPLPVRPMDGAFGHAYRSGDEYLLTITHFTENPNYKVTAYFFGEGGLMPIKTGTSFLSFWPERKEMLLQDESVVKLFRVSNGRAVTEVQSYGELVSSSGDIYYVKAGGKELPYCAAGAAVGPLPKHLSGERYYNCNADYAILTRDASSAVIERKTGRVLLDGPFSATFPSARPEEDKVILSASDGENEESVQISALLDLKRPARLSLFTGSYLETNEAYSHLGSGNGDYSFLGVGGVHVWFLPRD